MCFKFINIKNIICMVCPLQFQRREMERGEGKSFFAGGLPSKNSEKAFYRGTPVNFFF